MSTTPTPPNGMVSNTELILRKILGEDVTPLPPNSRVEFYLLLVKDLIANLQNAINLKGETTTPLTDNATTNPIMIDGESYIAVMNDGVFYQSKEFIFDGTKWHELGDLTNLTSLNIGAMTGYSKPSETSAIAIADTLNEAIGKLEKALDLKQPTIDANNKLSADLVDDTNTTHKFATQAQLEEISTTKSVVADMVDGSFKNLIPVTRDDIKAANTNFTWNGYTATAAGLSFTVNEDLSVTISGTTTATVYEFILLPRAKGVSFLPNGDYVLSGDFAGTYGSALLLGVNRTSGGSGARYATYMGTPVEFTVSDGPVANGVWIGIASETTGLQINTTVKPMICTKSAWDVSQKYVPYRPTYEETVEQVTTNKNNILSEQAKTTGMTEGGSNYITVGGIRVYVSATAPTGARTGDLWIGG